jgi:hypothetical protein
MQAFCVLGIVIIGGSKELDRRDIVAAGMKLRDIKVLMNTKVNKDRFIIVEELQGLFKSA